MVCPNCHSDRIITVQDQHFCINCGQQVPEELVKAKPAVAVGENGLPEGVKILPIGSKSPAPAFEAMAPESKPSKPAAAKNLAKSSQAIAAATIAPIINHKAGRLAAAPSAMVDETGDTSAEPAAGTLKATRAKKRKPGRPKAGRLDTPRPISSLAPKLTDVVAPGTLSMAGVGSAAAADVPAAVPKPPSIPAPIVAPAGPRTLSDIAPRRPQPQPDSSQDEAAIAKDEEPKARPKAKKAKKAAVHKVGVPPLHYGHVLAFSARARAHGHWLALGMLAASTLAFAAGYLAWLFLNGGLPAMTAVLLHPGIVLLGEAALLAVLYYIGRSVGQAAIIFGVARETDARPAPLSNQLAVGINTFGRRLRLDLGFGLVEAAVVAAIAAAVLFGGNSWPSVPMAAQAGILFVGFSALLYLLTSLALARGLAGVALTLTQKKPFSTAKLGWQLFSHRFELVAMRFMALAMELFLAVPLAALAVVFIATIPAMWHWAVVIAVGLLALLAGGLFGAGTAAWWTALYRRLVQADWPAEESTLLTGYAASPARPGALTTIVALSSFLIAAALALPWIKF